MNQMAEDGKKINHSNKFLFVSSNWWQLKQVCTNCVVVTGPTNTLLCCWITLAEASNLPSLTKIKFIAEITDLEEMENSSGEVQQQFESKKLRLVDCVERRGESVDYTCLAF